MANNKQKPSSQKDFLTQLQKISKLPAWAWGVIIGSLLLLIAILYLSNFQIDFNAGKVNFDRKIKLSQAEKDLSDKYSKSFKQYDKKTFESEANISKITQNLNSANSSSKTGFAKLFDKITFWRESSSTSDTLQNSNSANNSSLQQSESTNNNSGDIKQKIGNSLSKVPLLNKIPGIQNKGLIEPVIKKIDSKNGQNLYLSFGRVESVMGNVVKVSVSKYVDHQLTLHFSNFIAIQVYQDNKWQTSFSIDKIKAGSIIAFRWWADDQDLGDGRDLQQLFSKMTGDSWQLTVADILVADEFSQIWQEN